MKKLIISGASRGIGLACAQQFIEAGFEVLNLSRSQPADERIQHQTVDMSQPDFLGSIAERLDSFVSDADSIVLVHNAAKLINDNVTDVDPAALREMLELNVVSAAILNRHLLPKMTSGAVLYVGSTLGEKAVPNSLSYVVSKHALTGMMKATCQDLKGRQVHTACICPGFTNTEMLRDHVGQDASILAALAENVTMGRLIEPHEIASVVLFAAENPVINGAVLHANLGQVEH